MVNPSWELSDWWAYPKVSSNERVSMLVTVLTVFIILTIFTTNLIMLRLPFCTPMRQRERERERERERDIVCSTRVYFFLCVTISRQLFVNRVSLIIVKLLCVDPQHIWPWTTLRSLSCTHVCEQYNEEFMIVVTRKRKSPVVYRTNSEYHTTFRAVNSHLKINPGWISTKRAWEWAARVRACNSVKFETSQNVIIATACDRVFYF